MMLKLAATANPAAASAARKITADLSKLLTADTTAWTSGGLKSVCGKDIIGLVPIEKVEQQVREKYIHL